MVTCSDFRLYQSHYRECARKRGVTVRIIYPPKQRTPPVIEPRVQQAGRVEKYHF
jgi:hypothetical protein